MKNISKTIIFFGTEDFSLVSLQALIEDGYNIAAVVTKPDSLRGRGKILTSPSVKVLAEKHNIPVWQPNIITEIEQDIKNLGDVAGVLVSFGKIIPQSTINLFNPGIINVHPSLLPKYRGPSPIESAIINGDIETGVTIMQLSAAMDAGPIYSQVKYQLTGKETRPELYKTLAKVGSNLLINTLPSILDNSLQPVPQNDSEATYCKLNNKSQSYLNFAELTAAEAERQIRAQIDFPKSKIIINGKEIIVTNAHISNTKNNHLDFLCQDGNYLSIDELVAPSGRKMSAIDYLNGYKI